MNKKVLVTLSLGIVSLILMIMSRVINSFAFLTMVLSLIGSFVGIWYLFSLLFKSLILDKKEKLYLFIGTMASLLAFGLGRYGFMLFFWFPGAVVGILFLKLLTAVLNKTASVMTSPLQDKISKMEEELKQRESKQTPSIKS